MAATKKRKKQASAEKSAKVCMRLLSNKSGNNQVLFHVHNKISCKVKAFLNYKQKLIFLMEV
jgi:hypothetical protein